MPMLEAENGGRLMKWDPVTRKATVVARNLWFPNGVTFSKDHSFLVIAETGMGRLVSLLFSVESSPSCTPEYLIKDGHLVVDFPEKK